MSCVLLFVDIWYIERDKYKKQLNYWHEQIIESDWKKDWMYLKLNQINSWGSFGFLCGYRIRHCVEIAGWCGTRQIKSKSSFLLAACTGFWWWMRFENSCQFELVYMVLSLSSKYYCSAHRRLSQLVLLNTSRFFHKFWNRYNRPKDRGVNQKEEVD